jgi:hypothetical protein
MECPKCGYVLQPFETECPRCARLAEQKCSVCGRTGVVGRCRECGAAVCEACAVSVNGERCCSACAPTDAAAAHGAQLAATGAEAPLPGPGFVRAVSLPGEAGFWGNLQRGWAFMRESLAMAFRDKDLLLPSLLSVFVSVALLVAIVVLVKGLGLTDRLFGEDRQPGAAQLIVLLAIAFVFYAISYFFTGMTVHLINVHLRGRDARLGPAFRDALKNLGGLLALAAVSAVVSLLTSRRRRRGLSLGDVAAGAVERLWTVAVYLLLPIIILEDVSLVKAVGRAKDIHARNLVPIAVAEIGVLVVNRIIGFLAVIVLLPIAYLAVVAGGAALLIPMLVVAGIWLALVMAYTSFVRTAYYTCLYLWAVERAVNDERAAVPRPLAVALGA